MAHRYLLERAQFIPRPLEEVFAFFANAENLETLTPAFLKFKILSPRPIEMRAGALIDYELSLWGKRVRWRTGIDEFEQNRRFVDSQLKGPYRLWRHTHSFYAVDGGTIVIDSVEYELPLGPLGWVAQRLLVANSLDKIFDFRRKKIAEFFEKRL